jgi:energy-coupling factor transporter ATP-binding protein EcfA2
MCLSFAELATALHKDLQLQAVELARFVARVCDAGFANYPLGAAVDLFSPGEKSLLAALVGELGMLRGTRYLLDAAYSAYSAEQSSAQEMLQERFIVATPRRARPQVREATHASLSEVVRLKDLNCGPLRISEFTFPIGALSAVQGPTGSGKSLLLELVATRFTKRRKLKHVSSFGGIERCLLLSGLADSSGTVLELLGLTADLAAEIARTRRAKELGLLERELELPRSKFRCVECGGMGHTSKHELCSVCQGSLYDWRVAGLKVLGRGIAELVKAPLQELIGVLWTQKATDSVVKLVAAHCDPSLSLSTPVSNLNPSTRRFLKLLGGLGRYGGAYAPGSDKHSLTKELILMDGPHAMPDQHQQTIVALISELQKRGATVLYAGIPESLESMADSVLRLGADVASLERRSEEQFLDARYARVA